MGRVLGSIVLLVVIVFGLAWAFGFVNLQQTRDAQLPTVSVQGGQMPKFDADVANVQVGTKTETVEVPKVDVGTAQKTVEVPAISVEKPAK
ncbi:hypothetical protein LWE61_09610 [Sphingobium sufflavum]|uniref:hypothetical protein n=1 Tax=Sphingobium sufflavum TaxID=1129547 RepID=UPI001F405A9C|nr:hypothetical protein [Sphingobium sufflavum]MCE7796813.1 hypothetical protein [Sphingobium sufflavum]